MYATVEAPVIVETGSSRNGQICGQYVARLKLLTKLGGLPRPFRVDGGEVMNIIVQDTKLNVSPAYMHGRFAYGGSCLPKDLSALLYYEKWMFRSPPKYGSSY